MAEPSVHGCIHSVFRKALPTCLLRQSGLSPEQAETIRQKRLIINIMAAKIRPVYWPANTSMDKAKARFPERYRNARLVG